MYAMTTKAIRNVELVATGTHAASTGVTKVTRADLEAMLAAHADGLVDHAPVKLGHVSGLNDGIELGDGAPAYGWVVPTGIVDKDGRSVLIGDLVGMPAQLADVAPTAYRRRSVEIAWGVKTPAGKTYAAALIGIALLGATPPAVKGLEDLVALYSAETTVERTGLLEVVDGLEGNTVAVAMLAAARQAGAPIAQLDAMAAAAGARDTADVPPPVADTVNDGAHDHPAGQAGTPDTGGHPMTDEQLRKALGLEADADVDAALKGILDERSPSTDPATPEQPATPAAPATPAEPATDPAKGDDAPPAATVPGSPASPEVVQLSAATYAELTEFAAESRQRRRDEALDGAIRTGRIAPAERALFAAQMETNEAGTITLLGQLAPRFAVAELGADHAGDAPNAETDQAFDDFEARTFGLDRTRK